MIREKMEPVLVGKIIWDNSGQPLLDKTKEKYAEEFLGKIETTLSKVPFNKRKPNINIEVEKGIGYIYTNTGDINF